MNVGFIGAGKVGCALGRYFAAHGIPVTGYHDVHPPAAQLAAKHTDSSAFPDAASLAASSDIIFLTVPDALIAPAWHSLREACDATGASHSSGATDATDASHALAGKIVCHCSGCLPASVIDDAAAWGASAAGLHPLLAVSDPLMDLRELEGAHLTLEGDAAAADALRALLASLPNPLHAIDEDAKVRYHAAAVLASNLVLAPLDAAERLMASCGFGKSDAREALKPLIRGNVDSFCARGAAEALTGPVERNDAPTVEGHLRALDAHDPTSARLYRALTCALVGIARDKHPERDYAPLEALLETGLGSGEPAGPARRSAAQPAGARSTAPTTDDARPDAAAPSTAPTTIPNR